MKGDLPDWRKLRKVVKNAVKLLSDLAPTLHWMQAGPAHIRWLDIGFSLVMRNGCGGEVGPGFRFAALC